MRYIEIPINPAFHVGERVEVAGRVEDTERWQTKPFGEVIGIAIGGEEDWSHEATTHHLEYHVQLDNGTHIYCLDDHLSRLSAIKPDEEFEALHRDALATMYQLLDRSKSNPIDPVAVARLGVFQSALRGELRWLKELEHAALAAYGHLRWMDERGLLTREEMPMLEGLRSCFEGEKR